MKGFSKQTLDLALRMVQDLIDLNRATGFSQGNNGLVGGVVLVKGKRPIPATSYKRAQGEIVHGERAAIEAYEAAYGAIPRDAVMVVSLSPCESDDMEDRVGCSCSNLMVQHGLSVYCAVHDYYQGKRKLSSQYAYPMRFTGDRSIRERARAHRNMIGSISENNRRNRKK